MPHGKLPTRHRSICMYLLRCNLLIEVDDFFRHLLHHHAGHDIVLRMRDEDVERILAFACRLSFLRSSAVCS